MWHLHVAARNMNRRLFLLGMALLLIPVGKRLLENEKQKDVISTYHKEVEDVSEDALQKVLTEAGEYNRQLYEEGTIDKEKYELMLNPLENGIMGSIQIPKLDLKLPIGHGTGEDVLSVGVGHLRESSLPVGGENTHSILSGHRGLPDAQLFTRLDELEEGDLFSIHVCNQVLLYQVCKIQVVNPEDRSVIQIEEGRDMVSLITCTPYGLNTHRLVVTGERIFREEKMVEEEGETDAEVLSLSRPDLFYCSVPALLLAMKGAWELWKRRRK